MSKIIEFPNQKKSEKPTENTTKNKKVYKGIENKKVLFSASIVSIFTVASLLNLSLQVAGPSSGNGSRNIASVGDVVVDEKVMEWEKQVLDKIKNNPRREIASIGKKPSAADQVIFGDLNGNYRMNMGNDNKVNLITFEAENSNDPSYITERKEFLIKNYNMFISSKPTVTQLSKKVNSEQNLEEEYLLKSENSNLQKKVRFILDQHGRLVSLQRYSN
jgi:hypothetical protein